MTEFPNPYLPEAKVIEASGYTAPLGPGLRERNKMNYANSTGVLAQPGKALSKAERQKRAEARKDSVMTNMDGSTEEQPTAEDDRYTFSGLWRRMLIALNHWFGDFVRQRNRDLEQHFVPAGTEIAALRARNGRHEWNLRSFIVFVISLLLVFGPAYMLLEYLLLATRASAACTPVTNYIPVTVTETHTIYAPPPSSSLASAITGSSSQSSVTTSYSTLYSTSTLFNTVTMYATLLGMPPSAQTTVTTTRIVSPVSTMPISDSDTTIIIQSTATDTATVTIQPYTSTTFSFVSPVLTTTSTSTQYTTISVLNAPSSSSSYAGPRSPGWNASSSAIASLNGTDGVRTLTGTYYLGSGTVTTSTGTTLITTTISMVGPSSLASLSTSFPYTPSVSSSSSTSAAAAVTATLSSSTSRSSSMSISTAASAPSQYSSASAGISPSALSSSAAYPNVTSADALTGSSSSSLLPYGYSTGVMPVPVSPLASASIAASANSSVVNALSTSATSSSTSSSASVSSTTAAVVVPITSTISAGNLTTILETTSTTIDLIGSITTTVSGYFVYNGTTTYGSVPAAVTAPSASLSAMGSSFVASALSGSTSSASSSTSSSALSMVPSTSPATTPSMSGSAPSVSIPVNGSTAALSVLSSVMSGLTASSSSALSISSPTLSVTLTSTSSSSVSSPASASTLLTTTSSSSSSTTASPSGSSTSPISGSASSSLQPYTLPPSTTASSTSASSFSNPFPASSATATPTACGEHGNFTLNFDNLPNFVPSNQNGTGMNQTDITQAPPIPNPYNHLTFSDGYVYAPQPGNLPYQPVSPPHLAVFLANASGVSASSMPPGEIGDGPYESMSAFWFDAFSGFFGCDDAGPTPCTLVFTGYTYSPAAKKEIATYHQNATVPPCPGLSGCHLQQVSFPTSFRSLSGIQIQAFVDDQEKMFFMDNLALSWSNNTCAAGLTRLQYQ